MLDTLRPLLRISWNLLLFVLLLLLCAPHGRHDGVQHLHFCFFRSWNLIIHLDASRLVPWTNKDQRCSTAQSFQQYEDCLHSSQWDYRHSEVRGKPEPQHIARIVATAYNTCCTRGPGICIGVYTCSVAPYCLLPLIHGSNKSENQNLPFNGGAAVFFSYGFLRFS